MRTTLLLTAALALLISGTAPAATYDSPGEYSATLAVASALLPPDMIPPGTPVLGPTVYEGTLRIRRTGRGYQVHFQGESFDGHTVNAQAKFGMGWEGVRTEPLPVNGGLVDAIVDVDPANLMRGRLNGTVLVDGFTSRVEAKFGPGGILVNLRVH